ncbi:hypothetical protein SEPCBS119000_005954 [Sporothrix epigloea]|uniref:Uncharacterized protein n=1 Tax=Sporothrix epigloea TaxID=1892477 RepID=A0ABP0E292_9PEZI
MIALPVDGSWRMVEGENDSFDTSIVPAALVMSCDNGDQGQSEPSTEPSSQQLVEVLAKPRRSVFGPATDKTVIFGQDSTSLTQQDRIRRGESFTSEGGSFGGSQDDDIHSFLRKAESDENFLLRSPFQPSLPFALQSLPNVAKGTSKTTRKAARGHVSEAHDDRSQDSRAYQSSEPKLYTHADSMDSSPETEALGPSKASPSSQRQRIKMDRTNGGLQSQEKRSIFNLLLATVSANNLSVSCFLLLPLFGLAISYYAPCILQNPSSFAIRAACSLPDMTTRLSRLRNSYKCAKFEAAAAKDPAEPMPAFSLARGAFTLMQAQAQLAEVVLRRILDSRQISGIEDGRRDRLTQRAEDVWLEARAQTKDLRNAAQLLQKVHDKGDSAQNEDETASLLIAKLDSYLDAVKQVSVALTRLQTGSAAASAEALTYRSRQTWVQLRRMAAAAKSEPGYVGGLTRIFSNLPPHKDLAGQQRAQLLDIYRHHTDAVVNNVRLRADEAEAVLVALRRVNGRLERVQRYVAEHLGELVRLAAIQVSLYPPKAAGGNTGGDLAGSSALDALSDIFSGLWAVLSGQFYEWMSNSPSESKRIAQALRHWLSYSRRLKRLYDGHDVAVGRAVDTLDTLVAVRDELRELQLHLHDDGKITSDGNQGGKDETDDLDLQLHMDIVDAGIRDLKSLT